jgi:hypothetical protein
MYRFRVTASIDAQQQPISNTTYVFPVEFGGNEAVFLTRKWIATI